MSGGPVQRALRAALFAAAVVLALPAVARSLNGFDLTDALVPSALIVRGGPPRDGIPAIDRPEFIAAAAADFVAPPDPVLGLVLAGEARAYPLRILNWHEIVNDRFGAQAVVVTYCPLCGTGVAFAAQVQGRTLSFGVSGLLDHSDVLLYDRQTQSLWSQLLGQAISGPLKGTRLRPLPLTQTTWGDWRQRGSATRVLSTHTGATRPYTRDPYAGYAEADTLYFPVAFRAAGFPPKERVLGVERAGRFKAWPFVELARAARAAGVAEDRDFELADRVVGQPLRIRYNAAAGRATAHAENGAQLPAVVGFWFAWSAFHPQTEVFRAATAASPPPALPR